MYENTYTCEYKYEYTLLPGGIYCVFSSTVGGGTAPTPVQGIFESTGKIQCTVPPSPRPGSCTVKVINDGAEYSTIVELKYKYMYMYMYPSSVL